MVIVPLVLADFARSFLTFRSSSLVFWRSLDFRVSALTSSFETARHLVGAELVLSPRNEVIVLGGNAYG